MSIKDSGHRREFESGALRDRGEDKGIPMLISPYFVENLGYHEIMERCEKEKLADCITYVYKLFSSSDLKIAFLIADTIQSIYKNRNKEPLETLLSPSMIRDLSKHMELGAKKYSARNWEKGMPLEEYLNSLVRHLIALSLDERDESHLAASAFNIMAFIHTKVLIDSQKLPKTLEINNAQQ